MSVISESPEVLAGEVDAFDAEDVQPLETMITPELPSREQIEAHRVDHWPYRSWCKECVEGFGRERDHGHKQSRVAIISMDYAFVTPKGPIVDEGDEGWDDPSALKLLIVKDSKSGSVFAHAVVQKGIDDKRFAVDMVVRDVLWLGYPQVVLKSDNEPAVVKVLQEALGALKVTGVQAGEEHSPPYDPQANGAVESAVKQVKGRLRTMKLCLERRIRKRIPPRHPIIAWMVTHVADLLRFRLRGMDGKTPYERVRLRPFSSRLVCFGESCLYKGRSKEPVREEHIWHRGVFIGICQLTGQYVLYNSEQKIVKMARTVKLVPDADKWNTDSIESLTQTPFSEHVAQDQGVVFQERDAQPGDVDPASKKSLSRRLYILPKDLKDFGFTVGCPKCDHERRYGPGQTTKSHSAACRTRIAEELSKTTEGQRRLTAVEERLRKTVSEAIEQDQVPPVHGGGVEPLASGAPELQFEDLDPVEHRHDPISSGLPGSSNDMPPMPRGSCLCFR